MSDFFKRFHCHMMYKIQMVNALLAVHRQEYVLAAELENDANRYQSELMRMEILK